MENFINLIKDGAIKGQEKNGVLASLTIAQAILESGWGEHVPANNLFGIKWTSGCEYDFIELPTKEYVNGKWITVNTKFRKYNSLADSVLDHSNFLVENSRYNNLIGVTDYKEVCELIQKDGYATDPNYSKLLIQIIEENKLFEYDLLGGAKIMPIKLGESSTRVRILQVLLSVIMGGLTIDGVFGVQTSDVLKAYQKKKGLQIDGIAGEKSISAMLDDIHGALII